MKKGFKRGLALLMCASLSACALAGCAKKETEEAAVDWSIPAMTLGEDTISAGAMNFMLRYAEAQNDQWISLFYQMGYGNYWTSGYGDSLKDSVAGTLHNMLQTKQHMEDYGVELTEEEKQRVSDTADAFLAANTQETLDQMSATKENVEEILTLYLIQSKVEKEMVADVDTEVSDEEAAQRTVRVVTFTPQTQTEEDEEETETLEEAISEAAEDVADEVAEALTEAGVTEEKDARTGSADGADPAEAETEDAQVEAETEDEALELAKEIAYADAVTFLESVKDVTDAEAFTQAGEDFSEGQSAVAVNTLSFGKDDTTPDAKIIEATNDLEDNTLVGEVIDVNDVYYVLFVEYAFDREATDARKDEIVQDRKDARLEELYGEWETEDGFTTNSAALDLMVFDMFLLPPETEPESEALSEAESEQPEEIETEAETEVVTEAATE